MAWGRRSLPHDLDHILDTLPDEYLVRTVGGARIVVGPGGAHIVVTGDASGERARVAARLAATARSTLAEHLAWVPFVHTLVVSEDESASDYATVVPLSLLAHLLTEGKGSIELDVLGPLRDVVASGVLDVLVSIAPAVPVAEPPTVRPVTPGS